MEFVDDMLPRLQYEYTEEEEKFSHYKRRVRQARNCATAAINTGSRTKVFTLSDVWWKPLHKLLYPLR